MMDEYSKMTGHNVPGLITGKPLILGGSQGRGDATARGAIYCIREAAKLLGLELKEGTLAIQGYGNAGVYLAQLAVELLGMRVVAISDSCGSIYCADGIDWQMALEHKKATDSVAGLPGTTITNEELLLLDVTNLCPAALENVITSRNAGAIRRK